MDYTSLIKKYDKFNQRDVLNSFSSQINFVKEAFEEFKLTQKINSKKIKNIVICGMGGSGFTGDIINSYINLDIPIIVVKDYNLPSFVGKDSFVICVSYSGNTIETLTAYDESIKRGAKIVTICSGGKLKEKSKDNILMKVGFQPRLSYTMQFLAVLLLLENTGFVVISDELKILKKLVSESSLKKIDTKAKKLAEELFKRVPVIYSSTRNFALSEKFKCDINETCKQHAFFNVFSEFNHNEIVGYTKMNKQMQPVFLIDDEDLDAIKKRMKIVKKLFEDVGHNVIQVKIIGGSRIEKLFYSLYLDSYTSFYLAMLNKVEPNSVEIIENLKKRI